jgi:hypothetical protein
MEVSGQLPAPTTLPPGKEPPVSIGEEAGWAPETVWTRWWREKFPAPHRESNPRTPIVQPVAQRYTDWAIAALTVQLVPVVIFVQRHWLQRRTASLRYVCVCVCVYTHARTHARTRTHTYSMVTEVTEWHFDIWTVWVRNLVSHFEGGT